MKGTLVKSMINTPVGKMIAIASDKGLCFLEFNRPKRSDLLERRLNNHFGNYRIINGHNDHSDLAAKWLDIYFNERSQPDKNVLMDVRGTDFEKQVWREMQKIPFGETMSYGDIAVKIGKPAGSRAVGGACGRNPVSIIVPCHRVVGSAGSLTGYGGGLDSKSFLLEHESQNL
jgi:methylated-DNA-[protein]-cysteine S-methyltransferase